MSKPTKDYGIPIIKPSIDYLLIESLGSVHCDCGKWGPLPTIIVLNTLDDVVMHIDIGGPTDQIILIKKNDMRYFHRILLVLFLLEFILLSVSSIRMLRTSHLK